LNTPGNDIFAEADRPAPRARRRSDDFLSRLGRFAAAPKALLESVARDPKLGHAWIVMGLVAVARGLSLGVEKGVDSRDALQSVAASAASGMFFWLFFTAVGHGCSRVFRKTGTFRTFLGLTGWSSGLVILGLPLTLVAASWPALGVVAGVGKAIVVAGFFYLLWLSLRMNYRWSPLGALAVVFLPVTLLSVLMTVGAALTALSALAGAFLAKGPS
jgi:hypothetical protein